MINLLPPQYKKELRGEERFRLVLILGMLLITFFICLSLSLLSIRVYVSGEIQTQQIVVESQRKEAGELRLQDIRKLNEEARGVSSFYEKRIIVSDIVERISNALPAGVYLDSLGYAPKKIILKGFALKTEDLLQIRTSLEQDSLFKNFQFPPSNWVRAENIDFSFDFEL